MTAAVPLVERLAEALGEHAWERAHYGDYAPPTSPIGRWGFRCPCGEVVNGYASHRAHIARALLPVVEQAVAEARGEALREAAQAIYDEWPGGTGQDGLVVMWAEDWLNDRADAIAATEGAE